MKFSVVPTLLLASLAKECLGGVSPPEISIGLNTASGSTSKLGGIEPSIKWKTTGSFKECDLSGGVEVTVTDVDSFKESVWGLVKRSIGGFGLSLRGEVSATAPEGIALDFQCDTPLATKLQLEATAGKPGAAFTVSKVKAKQTLDTPAGSLVVAPTYDLGASKGDLSLAFAMDGSSSIQVDVNTNKQAKLSLSQRMGSNHVIKPSITNSGQFEMDYSTTAMDLGTITTTYKPKHHVNIKWSDGPWQADFNIPMEGYYKLQDGVKISVKTKVDINP